VSSLTTRQTPRCRTRSTEGSATLSSPNFPTRKEANEPIDCGRTCALAHLVICTPVHLTPHRQDLASRKSYPRSPHLALSLPHYSRSLLFIARMSDAVVQTT
jgi:hypothetical protein